jgi:hypothetical protein
MATPPDDAERLRLTTSCHPGISGPLAGPPRIMTEEHRPPPLLSDHSLYERVELTVNIARKAFGWYLLALDELCV